MTSIGSQPFARDAPAATQHPQATIHAHDDALLSFFGSGAYREVKAISLDLPFVLGKPIHYVPAHVDVEADVSSAKATPPRRHEPWSALLGHGVTTLGRNVSEAYHRLNSLTAEVRRNIVAELLASRAGSSPNYRGDDEIQAMYRFAEFDHLSQARRARDA